MTDRIISIEQARADHARKHCRHLRIEVDEARAQVACLDCGALLNPVHILVRLTREESTWARTRDQCREAIAALKCAQEEIRAARAAWERDGIGS